MINILFITVFVRFMFGFLVIVCLMFIKSYLFVKVTFKWSINVWSVWLAEDWILVKIILWILFQMCSRMI